MKPLAGVRVIELAQNLAGPYCGRILSDLGADVIKIEPPTGDAARFWAPPTYAGDGTLFAASNAGKRSLGLDLREEGGADVLHRLLGGADVLLEALRPGALDALGFDWESVHRRHPRLIYASVLAYGEEGPLSHLPGYEPLMQAHAGLLSYTGEADGPPVRVGTSVVDLGTGMWTAVGVLAALRERDATGVGSRVSGALFDTALAWSGYHLLAALDGTVAGRWGTRLPMICPYGAFETRDGALMIAVGNDRIFRRFCPVLGLDTWLHDPGLARNADRVARREEVEAGVVRAMRERGQEELLEALREAGVPAAPIRDVGEVLAAPQTQASGMLAPLPHDERPDYVTPALPLRFGGSRPDPRTPPPAVGAGGREALLEAGLSAGEIDRLVAAGTVLTEPAEG
ncbi:MAG: CoA transferase [Gemmatimonadetes bacterium]|nr:CoA transferase [Gemmatimonadota bacterium]